MVAPITDSPKPPPNRITLTLPVLNAKTRHVVFCGAGSSKQPIVGAVFDWASADQRKKLSESSCTIPLSDPAPYPCGMVRPGAGNGGTLVWVIDADAMPASAKL